MLKERLTKKIVAYSGFAFAFLVFFMLKSLGGKLYVIDEDLKVSIYTSIGSFDIPMKGGATDLTCSVPFNRVGIANQSKKTLVIEGLQYSSRSPSSSSKEDQQIQSMAFETVFLSRGYISYFFDDNIPNEISVRGYSSQETIYWLHDLKKSIATELISTILEEGITQGIKHFNKMKKLDSYSLIEGEMNKAGYQLLKDGKVKEAIAVFKLNVAEFPTSSNAYDSLGEAFLKDGGKLLAIYNYKKSLELNVENSNATEILKKLGVK
jgi:hypothetical protein